MPTFHQDSLEALIDLDDGDQIDFNLWNDLIESILYLYYGDEDGNIVLEASAQASAYVSTEDVDEDAVLHVRKTAVNGPVAEKVTKKGYWIIRVDYTVTADVEVEGYPTGRIVITNPANAEIGADGQSTLRGDVAGSQTEAFAQVLYTSLLGTETITASVVDFTLPSSLEDAVVDYELTLSMEYAGPV